MGLIIEVFSNEKYRQCADASGGRHTPGALDGVSARHDTLTVVNVSGPFTPNDDRPAVALMWGHLPGTLRLVPVVNCAADGDEPEWQMFAPADKVGPMFGGNYGSTSDGRFADACEEILGHRFYGAVAIHDRYETREQYAALST